jgi:hypothetical protein
VIEVIVALQNYIRLYNWRFDTDGFSIVGIGNDSDSVSDLKT